jgi:hypothetical protein
VMIDASFSVPRAMKETEIGERARPVAIVVLSVWQFSLTRRATVRPKAPLRVNFCRN